MGERVREAAHAPKEQPPRKLSGQKDRALLSTLWKASPLDARDHRRGKPAHLQVSLSGFPTEGAWVVWRAGRRAPMLLKDGT